MAWNVYKPKPKPSPWRRVKPPKGKFNWSVVSKNKPATKAQIQTGTNRIASNILNSSSSSSSTDSGGYDPYPGYTDLYSGLLAQLSAMKTREEANMRANLTGREAAIKQLYADQAPLVDANYNQAIKSSAAVNDAVANRLAAEGQVSGSDLLAKLQTIQAPQAATDTAAKTVKDYYSGLGGANYAMDSGDVQRLIGAQAEQQTYNQKQPGIISAQLEAQFLSDLRDLDAQYNEQVLGMSQAKAQDLADYNLNKFQYEQEQKSRVADTKAQTAKDAEDRYWDNYWKNRDALERTWEINVARGKDTAANATKKQIAALDNQSKIDIANIRAGATTDAATIRANASTQNAQTKATQKNQPKPPTASQQKAANRIAYSAAIRPDNYVRYEALYGDTAFINSIKQALRAQGINPDSAVGRAAIKFALNSANNRPVFTAGKHKPAKYHKPRGY